MDITPKLINGFKTYPFRNKEQFLDFVKDKSAMLIAINAEKIIKKNPALVVLSQRHIGYADGVGTVMALKQKGAEATKIAGAEFWLDLIRRFEEDKSFYLVGAKPEVIEETARRLRQEFPNLKLIGYRDGYLKEGDVVALEKEIVTKRPDVVFVAMGSPKQEQLMEKLFQSHPALYMGLGGSFDVYCGRVKRAPKGFQKLGLEWFYRLLQQPTRIKRQVVYLRFMFRLITRSL